MFLGYDWLVKYNLEVNWNKGIIQFTRCLKEYKYSTRTFHLNLELEKLHQQKKQIKNTRK